MTQPQKSSYFTRVEDKYVFKVSTVFWHLLIAFITLAAIAGIFLLCWSLIPASKENTAATEYPSRPSYPAVETVNVNDLNDEVPVFSPAPPPVYQSTMETENDPDRPAYDLSLSELKRIIPQADWQPGYWTYPFGELAWQRYQTEQYRQWNPNGENIEQKLERTYSTIKAKNFTSKKRALDAYITILKRVPSENAAQVLTTITYSINDRFRDLELLDTTFSLVASSLSIYPSQNEAAQHLIVFVLNNPRSALEFISFASETSRQFPPDSRYPVLTALTSGHYSSFSNAVPIQKEATQQFLSLVPRLQSQEPEKALRKFYAVYNNKNKKRNAEIARINAEYNKQVAAIITDSSLKATRAEIKFLADQEIKNQTRATSIKAIGAGFVAIALLGTILTLLSIQRILKRMESGIEQPGFVKPILANGGSGQTGNRTAIRSCPNCKKAVEDGDAFCLNCGTKL
jgi:hypothetical protein